VRSNPRAIARSIQEWREAWARVLYTVAEGESMHTINPIGNLTAIVR
jgi:hypothetical protein